MNFLAHIFLSGNSEEMMIGNFIGDFVKGKYEDKYSTELKNGIRLHREIDWYTDNHALIDTGKNRLWEKYRHYGGVIIDMYYDHFLAVDFIQYANQDLKSYVSQSYELLEKHKDKMPLKAQKMLPFMINNNWLEAYQHVEGIKKALTGLSKRTKFKSNMEYAGEDLEEHYDAYKEEFHLFFPQIIKHTTAFINEMK